MVRGQRVLERKASVAALAITAALGVCGALFSSVGCAKKPRPPPPMAAILASEPSQRARGLRDEMAKLLAAGKVDEAASKAEAVARAIGDLLTAMDTLHHRQTAVPDFDVVRYVEALRDLGENTRGFIRLYSTKNPPPLKREMVQSFVDQLRLKIR